MPDVVATQEIHDGDRIVVMKFTNIYTKLVTFTVVLTVTPFIFIFVVCNMFSVMFFKRDIDFTNLIVSFIKLFEKKKEREVNTKYL